MPGAPLKQSFRPSLQIMDIIRTHGPLSRREIFAKAAEAGIATSNTHCNKMVNFLLKFGRIKVRTEKGKRYMYSEKHPQKGYPFNPYNYKEFNSTTNKNTITITEDTEIETETQMQSKE